MSMSTPQIHTRRWPSWILIAGLLGIANFLFGWWSLLTPDEDRIVHFWFVQFYSYAIIPSLILFPVSIIILSLWAAQLAKKSWAQVIITVSGLVITALCFMLALSGMFLSTLRMVGHIKQNNHVYYLVEYDDDRANDYAFCKADKFGFAGQCRYIGWTSADADLEFYIDQATNWITLKSDDPSFIWMNSVPPSCINNGDAGTDVKYTYVGGCVP
jgi:hypothetical protein